MPSKEYYVTRTGQKRVVMISKTGKKYIRSKSGKRYLTNKQIRDSLKRFKDMKSAKKTKPAKKKPAKKKPTKKSCKSCKTSKSFFSLWGG